MSNLYNVTLQIGKRKINTQFYASNHNNILTFVNDNLVAVVTKIQKVVYEAPDTVQIPIDDPLTYKSTMYFQVRNDRVKASSRIVISVAKLNRSVQEIYHSMKSLLKLGTDESIDAMTSVNISSR